MHFPSHCIRLAAYFVVSISTIASLTWFIVPPGNSRASSVQIALASDVSQQPTPVGAANGCDTPSLNLAPTFPAGTNPQSVAVGDFNGDGKNDLAVANNGSNNVSILLGSGDGSFGSATNFPAGTNPRAIVVADFNGDGKADLAVVNGGSNDVSLLLGTGTGSFGAATNFAETSIMTARAI